MNKFYTVIHLISVIFILLNTTFLSAQNNHKSLKENSNHRIDKLLANPPESIVDINSITSWVSNNGYHDWLVANSWNGSYPNGTFIGSIFTEGILWGGLVNDGSAPLVRVSGNTYGTGCTANSRLFRVRPDYMTADLTSDASDFFNVPIGEVTQNQIDELRQQYQSDWNEWPTQNGAPYKDVDMNGEYDPSVDIPGVAGSDQTLFINYRDGGAPLYGSDSTGLQITETYWGYASSGSLGNVVFKKVDLTYSGNQSTDPGAYIDSLYICQWADPDVGYSLDDFAGCDTALNLGYAYNSSNYDAIYTQQSLNPPAVGYSFLQGVSMYTGNPVDSAIVNFKWRHGYIYLNSKPLSSFVYSATGGTWSDPAFTSTGALEFYNMMRGFQPDPFYPSSPPFPSSVADYTDHGVFLLTGDPVAGTGKSDGILDAAGDRRILCINGPIHLELGQTAEVVIALVGGMGTSNLNSITKLKENTFVADTTFLGLVQSEQTTVLGIKNSGSKNLNSKEFTLYQNYPNPFNPATTIKYSIPLGNNLVTLKVYDILGNEIATLVNEEKPGGEYQVNFDASKLASGIYFYHLKSGLFVQTEKMIFLK
jgi:Secretion system C-terminal sorting domain